MSGKRRLGTCPKCDQRKAMDPDTRILVGHQRYDENSHKWVTCAGSGKKAEED